MAQDVLYDSSDTWTTHPPSTSLAFSRSLYCCESDHRLITGNN